jgi:transposase-like protein
MSKGTQHRQHKVFNNRGENAHKPTRRKEKYLIRFKSPAGVQNVLAHGEVSGCWTLHQIDATATKHILRG